MLTSVIGVAQNVPGIEVVWLSDAKIHRIFWACDSFTASSVVRQIEIFLEGKHDAY
jgi:hypothetical protein